MITRFPGLHTSFVVECNRGDASVGVYTSAVADAVLAGLFTEAVADQEEEEESPPEERQPVELTSDMLARWAGVYLSDEERQAVTCRKYRIDGAGLDHRGGSLWVSKAGEHFVEVEIDLPDEPGFKDVRLRLEKIERLDEQAWNKFVEAHLGIEKSR